MFGGQDITPCVRYDPCQRLLLPILFLPSTNLMSTISLLVHLCLPYLLHVVSRHASWRFDSVPSTLTSCTFTSPDEFTPYRLLSRVAQSSQSHTLSRQGLMDIWSPRRSFLHSLINLLDMNASFYFFIPCRSTSLDRFEVLCHPSWCRQIYQTRYLSTSSDSQSLCLMRDAWQINQSRRWKRDGVVLTRLWYENRYWKLRSPLPATIPANDKKVHNTKDLLTTFFWVGLTTFTPCSRWNDRKLVGLSFRRTFPHIENIFRVGSTTFHCIHIIFQSGSTTLQSGPWPVPTIYVP